MMDILRNGLVTVRDRKRIAALNDAGAIAEADAIFAEIAAGDPDIYGYRLRELRRRRNRIVHELQTDAPWQASGTRSAA
jgi:hypothetical protein